MRRLGAGARAMLVQAAANAWGVPAGEITTGSAMLHHKASGRSARYADMAEAAASIAPPKPESLTLKDPAQFRILGQRIGGVDNRALVTGKPLFGICRGLQEINVALGGTLSRELQDHHAPDDVGFREMFDHRHDVALTPGGLLARAHGRMALHVNSVHYQGLARLGDGLAVEAVAPDGMVEAVSARIGAAPVLAVQWHPEWTADTDGDAATFFHILGRALRGQHPETTP
jgi:anthranilate/para-aminobenzoate synthase component II